MDTQILWVPQLCALVALEIHALYMALYGMPAAKGRALRGTLINGLRSFLHVPRTLVQASPAGDQHVIL